MPIWRRSCQTSSACEVRYEHQTYTAYKQAAMARGSDERLRTGLRGYAARQRGRHGQRGAARQRDHWGN